MSMDEYNIGEKLRQVRKSRKMSLQKLAQEIGCSAALISLIENRKISPPIKTLSNIAKALNIPLRDIFEEEGERVAFEIIRRNEGNRRNNSRPQSEEPNTPERLPHAAVIRNKRMKHNFIRLPEGRPGYLKYLYSEESLVYIIRGKTELSLGNHSIPLEEGDSVYFETTTAHGFRSLGDSEVLILEVQTAA